jgi:hypothetical protein
VGCGLVVLSKCCLTKAKVFRGNGWAIRVKGVSKCRLLFSSSVCFERFLGLSGGLRLRCICRGWWDMVWKSVWCIE